MNQKKISFVITAVKSDFDFFFCTHSIRGSDEYRENSLAIRCERGEVSTFSPNNQMRENQNTTAGTSIRRETKKKKKKTIKTTVPHRKVGHANRNGDDSGDL